MYTIEIKSVNVSTKVVTLGESLHLLEVLNFSVYFYNHLKNFLTKTLLVLCAMLLEKRMIQFQGTWHV